LATELGVGHNFQRWPFQDSARGTFELRPTAMQKPTTGHDTATRSLSDVGVLTLPSLQVRPFHSAEAVPGRALSLVSPTDKQSVVWMQEMLERALTVVEPTVEATGNRCHLPARKVAARGLRPARVEYEPTALQR
jgi:hypothetical protein